MSHVAWHLKRAWGNFVLFLVPDILLSRAGKMLTTSTDSPSELRRKVTSPNGTTEAAIKSFENDNVRTVIANAVKAATSRGDELGKILGGQVSLKKLII